MDFSQIENSEELLIAERSNILNDLQSSQIRISNSNSGLDSKSQLSFRNIKLMYLLKIERALAKLKKLRTKN